MNSVDQNDSIEYGDRDQLSQNNISQGDFLAISPIDKFTKKPGKKILKPLSNENLMIPSFKV